MRKLEYKERVIKEEFCHYYCDKCNKDMGWATKKEFGGYDNPLCSLNVSIIVSKTLFDKEYYNKKIEDLCEDCYKKEKENIIKELESLGYSKE